MNYEAWQAYNAANIREWLTTEQLRAECGRLSKAGAPSPELLLAHAMRALESAQRMLAAVEPGGPFDGIRCRDVGGINWFDARDAAMKESP